MTLSKNILIYGVTNSLKSLVPFIMLPILTAYLSPEEYGILSLIEVSILILLPFILLNIHGGAKVEYYLLPQKEFKDYLLTALALSSIAFIIVFSCFYLFMNILSQTIGISTTLILLLPLFALLRVVSTILPTIFQVTNKPYTFALYIIVQALVDFAISLLLVIQFQLGYIGRLEGIYLAFLLSSIIGIFVLKKNYLGKVNLKKYIKSILNFGLPLIPHAIGIVIINMSGRYFISYFIGESEVGIYTVAYQISALSLLIGLSVNQAWSPIMFKLLKTCDLKSNKKVLSYSIIISGLFMVTTVIIYLLADPLFYFFVDKSYYRAKEYFPYLLLSFFFQSLYFIFVNFLFYEKKTYLVAGFTIFSALLNSLLNYFLIQYYETIGVAYATLATWIVYFILISFYVGRRWHSQLQGTIK